MFARGVQRDTVPSRKCDYPLLFVEYQIARNICVTVRWVRRVQSAIVPSAAEARDCRSPG